MKKAIVSGLVVAGVLFSGCSVLKQPEPPLTKERVQTGNGVVSVNINLKKPIDSKVKYTGIVWLADLGSDKTKKAIENSKEIQLPAGKYQVNVIGVYNYSINKFIATNALYYIAKKYNNPVEIDVEAGKENCFNANIEIGEQVTDIIVSKLILNWIEKANTNTQCNPNGKYIFPINTNTPKISLEIGFDSVIGLGYIKITKNGKSNIYYGVGIGKNVIEQKTKYGKALIDSGKAEKFVNYINKNFVIEQNELINKFLNGKTPAGIVK